METMDCRTNGGGGAAPWHSIHWQNNFGLDSICPTGVGKVAGVKIEIDEENWADGSEWLARFEVRSAAMNGNSRGKARAAQRGRGATKEFEQERTEKTERKVFAKNGLCLDMALQKRRNLFVAHGRDSTFIRGISRCRAMGKKQGRSSDWPTNDRKSSYGRVENGGIPRHGLVFCAGIQTNGMKRKWILRVAAGLAVFLVVVSVVLAFSLGTLVKKGVVTIGPKATKVEVKLKDAEVWVLGCRVQLNGFVLGNPPGCTMPSAIEVDSVSVRVKAGSAFSDKLVIESIKLKAPVITLEGGYTGDNLKKIEKNMDEYEGSSAKSGSSERKLQVNDLEITNAKLQVNTKLTGGRTITLSLPDIHLTDLGMGPAGITAVEVGQQTLRAVLQSAGKAVAKNAGGVGDGAASGAQGALKKAADSIKGLFQ
jgi:hypothetical protein